MRILPRSHSPFATDAQGAIAARAVLVTGGSRGIGAAIARELATEGTAIAINYLRSRRAAEALAASLPVPTVVLQADVSDPSQAESLVAAAIDELGRLDVLVVNAGIWRGGRVDQISIEDWGAVLHTDLFGAFYVTRAAVPVMRQQGGGRIVFIGSVIGAAGFAGDSAYAAAKAGLVGLAKSVARETAAAGITVNVVAPGFIETDMTRAVSQRARELLLERATIKSAGRVEDVAKAVRYLVEDAPYVTGQVMLVDGGLAG